jgi:hypothetical protein
LQILSNMMKASLVLLCLVNGMYYAQAQTTPEVDFSIIERENLEFLALKNTFYLVCQEYALYSRQTNFKTCRGSNDYFGRTFTVGYLSDKNKLWFPKYVRSPWKSDPNYADFYRVNYTPKCTLLKIRKLRDTLFINNDAEKSPVDSSEYALWMETRTGGGINFTDVLIKEGTLVTFYALNADPENAGDVSYSIAWLTNLEWNPEGICQNRTVPLGEKSILGGALFQRIITSGKIEWKLAGFYDPLDGQWVIRSAKTLL